MLIKSNATQFLSKFESDLKYYSINLPSRCYMERYNVEMPPINIVEITKAINKLNFKASFTYFMAGEKTRRELNEIVPGIAEIILDNGYEPGEDVVIVLDQSFGLQLSIEGEYPMYGEPEIYVTVNGIIAKENTELSDVEKHFEILKKLEAIDGID
ncbi:hypothetical protein D3C81_436570 [compost metagenome]